MILSGTSPAAVCIAAHVAAVVLLLGRILVLPHHTHHLHILEHLHTLHVLKCLKHLSAGVDAAIGAAGGLRRILGCVQQFKFQLVAATCQKHAVAVHFDQLVAVAEGFAETDVLFIRHLITGCRGQLGTELQHQLSAEGCAIGPLPERLRKATVIPVDVDELDITDREATINYIRRHQPDTVINCAAFTNVDGCETARDAAFRVNALGPRNLALACEKIGARLIHVSTDYVFPGTANGGVALDECAVPAPISAYGQTKLLGEQYVERFCRRHFIVRTAWLYSSFGHNFVKTMIKLGRERDKLGVVFDQIGTPTYARDLARAIMQILAKGVVPGVYHFTDEGVASWYDFTKMIHKYAGIDSCKVSPLHTSDYPTPATRPHYSVLDKTKIKKTFDIEIPYWADSVKECVDILLKQENNQ